MRKLFTPLTFLAVILVAGCSDDVTAPVSPPSLLTTASAETYVVLGLGEVLPANLDVDVAAAGGSVVVSYPEIGVAYVSSGSPSFRNVLAQAKGVESVTPDTIIQWIDPVQVGQETADETAALAGEVASIGDTESFYSFQWAPAAIQAPEAWNAGYRGQGVRVAILDGAIYNNHVDLAGNLDVAASRSFVPGFAYNQDVGTFWHGTHVAGIVAARGNGIGTIGIAPQATLIGVKVLHNGTGAFAGIVDGILYAAKPVAEGGAGAQVINMSLGATLDDKKNTTKADVRELKKAIDRATKYAYQRGVTVIVSAGNGATNFDDAKTLFKTPAQNEHVISVSATGPHGWALGSTDFARPTYYTDYGKSLVDVAAPGGTAGLLVVDGNSQVCTKTGTIVTLTRPCYVFDMVMSTVRGGPTSTASYNWAQGTSMAAPMVSGVAALIIQKNGGTMHPAQVRAMLQQAALDLGKPGQDEFYGQGWVNAYRAVQ